MLTQSTRSLKGLTQNVRDVQGACAIRYPGAGSPTAAGPESGTPY